MNGEFWERPSQGETEEKWTSLGLEDDENKCPGEEACGNLEYLVFSLCDETWKESGNLEYWSSRGVERFGNDEDIALEDPKLLIRFAPDLQINRAVWRFVIVCDSSLPTSVFPATPTTLFFIVNITETTYTHKESFNHIQPNIHIHYHPMSWLLVPVRRKLHTEWGWSKYFQHISANSGINKSVAEIEHLFIWV